MATIAVQMKRYDTDHWDELEPLISAVNIPDLPASKITTGIIDVARIPQIALTKPFEVANEAAMLALTAEEGDLAIRADTKTTWVHNGSGATTLLSSWTKFETPTDTVISIAGYTGVVSTDNLRTAIGTNNAAVAALVPVEPGVTFGKFLQYDNTWAVPTNTWQQNTSGQDGYVLSGAGQDSMVWKTNESGVPAWRPDEDTQLTIGTDAGEACAGDDSRLDDARTPLAHDIAVHTAANNWSVFYSNNLGEIVPLALPATVGMALLSQGAAAAPEWGNLPAANVVEDASHRFITDAERTEWDGKSVILYEDSDPAGVHGDLAYIY